MIYESFKLTAQKIDETIIRAFIDHVILWTRGTIFWHSFSPSCTCMKGKQMHLFLNIRGLFIWKVDSVLQMASCF